MTGTTNKEERLVWLDLETTGLEARNDLILEIGLIVTEPNLDIVAEQSWLIKQPRAAIKERMNPTVVALHRASGLLDQLSYGKGTFAIADACNEAVKFLGQHAVQGKSPLCGNSVWLDKTFIMEHARVIHNFVHYRVIDVSTIKELVRRWNPKLFERIEVKKLAHRALPDLHESIAELRTYHDYAFRLPITEEIS